MRDHEANGLWTDRDANRIICGAGHIPMTTGEVQGDIPGACLGYVVDWDIRTGDIFQVVDTKLILSYN